MYMNMTRPVTEAKNMWRISSLSALVWRFQQKLFIQFFRSIKDRSIKIGYQNVPNMLDFNYAKQPLLMSQVFDLSKEYNVTPI